MTAHPIELIAGLDDGIDLDQKDQVTRHIAACDTCRTVARTMQRVDSLIALPEPMLALPARAMPRRGMAVPPWASLATVVVTLAVVIGVTVGSLRQSQVSTAAAADACALLTTAAYSIGVDAASAKAAPIPGAALPSRLSESWKACALTTYSPDGALLLFRTRATYRWDIDALLADVASGDRTTSQLGQELTDWGQLLYGRLTPRTGDTSTDRWIISDGANPGNRQAMLVFADPYFFAVSGPLPDGAGRLADAIVAELRRRPWPLLSAASKTDACAILARAEQSLGRSTTGSGAPALHRHGMDTTTSLGAWPNIVTNVCGFESNVAARDSIDGFLEPHLILRVEPTTPKQAASATDLNGLLRPLSFPNGPLTSNGVLNVYGWIEMEPGMWMQHAEDSTWTIIAVFTEPYFFAVTEANDDAAVALARAVMAELKRP